MKFIIEPSAASGMIRLPLKKEMKVPSLWEIMGKHSINSPFHSKNVILLL